MPGRAADTDFSPQRRASAAAVAREVADVLTDEGYNVIIRDYDVPFGASLIEKVHEAIENGIVVLYSRDSEIQHSARPHSTSLEATQRRAARTSRYARFSPAMFIRISPVSRTRQIAGVASSLQLGASRK
jgi:hypothetical protein